MPDGTSDPFAAWRSLLLAHSRAVRAVEHDLDAAGTVPLSWYDVLLELNAAPERRLRMQDLAQRAVLSRTRVSRVVTELEAAGLVERVADPADGRATLAALTAAGRTSLRAAAPVYRDSVARHFTAHLSDAQERAIAEGLSRVVVAHDAVADPRR